MLLVTVLLDAAAAAASMFPVTAPAGFSVASTASRQPGALVFSFFRGCTGCSSGIISEHADGCGRSGIISDGCGWAGIISGCGWAGIISDDDDGCGWGGIIVGVASPSSIISDSAVSRSSIVIASLEAAEDDTGCG